MSGEGPRERLFREGPEALSLIELIAVLLRTGSRGRSSLRIAEELLRHFGSLEGLARAGDGQIRCAAGIGPAKLAGLRAAFELGARLVREPLRVGVKISSPEQVAAHYGPRMRSYRQEVFVVLLLDARHRVIADIEVHRGSLDQSLVHPREVFAPALRESAAAILVLHNHPSGDPTPSEQDREVTRRLVQAGEILGVRLVDHVVIGADSHRSLARAGLLGPQAVPLQGR
jgi:DNA repair protein RadC